MKYKAFAILKGCDIEIHFVLCLYPKDETNSSHYLQVYRRMELKGSISATFRRIADGTRHTARRSMETLAK